MTGVHMQKVTEFLRLQEELLRLRKKEQRLRRELLRAAGSEDEPSKWTESTASAKRQRGKRGAPYGLLDSYLLAEADELFTAGGVGHPEEAIRAVVERHWKEGEQLRCAHKTMGASQEVVEKRLKQRLREDLRGGRVRFALATALAERELPSDQPK